MKYKVLEGDGPPTAKQLEEFYEEGWELVQIIPPTPHPQWIIYLKKAIQ